MNKISFTLIIIGIILISYSSYSIIKESSTATSINSEILEPKPINNHKEDFQKGVQIGSLLIPDIDKSYPVYLGTESETLKKGAGLLESQWTTLPSEKGHTVISGHRDTVFRDLRHVKKGHILLLSYQGQLYSYQVQKMWITDKDDRTVIVEKETPTLTLTTCYPFFYVGNAPKRYIIEATLKEDTVLY